MAAVCAAGWLLGPTRADGWAPLGGLLPLGQRDFRVFDNFSDPSARDNSTEDPRFPGQTSAVLAIWKACVEWGSEPHGDGEGDPHQPGNLGSGGANFDCTFQGLANGVGGIDDNVHSELDGCQQTGLLAFMEAGASISDGWRIRYCADQTWEDGPDTNIPASRVDLQGVATHEYGHALGLDHTAVSNATMYATVTGSGVGSRSIATDDKAGVKALYGVRSPTKPEIQSTSIAGGDQLTIHGQDFSLSGNEVWFTPRAAGNGTPVKVGGLTSANGTAITLDVPTAAGPGDILVRIPGAGGDKLSNAYPFDPDSGPTRIGSTYCSPATVNSSGRAGKILARGSVVAADDYLILEAKDLPTHQLGYFLIGDRRVVHPQPGSSAGILCVGGGLTRILPPALNSGSDGGFRYALGTTQVPGIGSIVAGQSWNFTTWFRDAGQASNFTDAVGIAFQ